MEHKVLIINAKGSKPNSSVKGIDLHEKRRDAIKEINSDMKPDIILMQETTKKNLKHICNQDFGNKEYKNFDIKNNPNKEIHASIIYDSIKYKVCKDPTYTNTGIRFVCAYTQHINEKLNISADEIVSRMSAVILQHVQENKPNPRPFLCVSWHGPHKKTIKERKKICHDLCLLLSLYSYERQIPVILGGDFNLDLMSLTVPPVCWPSTMPVYYKTCNMVVNDYTKLDNRPNKIDYLLTSETFINVCCIPIHILEAVLGKSYLALHVTLPTDIYWNVKLVLKSKDKILVMNAKKLVPDVCSFYNKGEDLSNLQMEVMYQVIKDEKPDIVLIQESNFQLNNICKKFENGKYQAIDGEDAGIIFNATKFDVVIDWERTTRNLFQLEDSKICSYKVSKRVCAVILQQKGPNTQPFLCLSWHGSHKKLVESKQIKDFLRLPIYLCADEETFPVIVGKDFNLEHTDNSCTPNPYKIFISDTNMTNENLFLEKVDTTDIVKKLNISCPKLYLSLKNVFDHDPLKCTITQP